MIKRLIASLLIGIFLFTSFSFAYEDVPPTSPYFYAVEYLRQNKVVPDKKLFRPDLVINKAEFIKYLVKVNNPDFKPIKRVRLPFEDTNNNASYAPYIHEAIQLGILSDREKVLNPYRKLKLYEALELVFHSKSIPIPKTFVGDIPYKDLKRNKRLAPLIMRAMNFNLTSPERANYFGARRKVTRVQAAQMIYKMELYNLSPTTPKKQEITSSDPQLQKIISAWQLINANYVERDKIDATKLSDAAIDAIVQKLDDPYSAYLDKEKNAAFSDDLGGKLEGIGAYIAMDEEGNIAIVSPIKDSPADKAGVKAGDIIKKINDLDTADLSLYEAVSHIKGPKGTMVQLTIERNKKIIEILVVRDVIVIPALEYELKENDSVMYIKLYHFNQNASKEFKEVTEIIQQNSKVKGVIIDLRNNPGGLLNSSIEILNHLLPSQSIAVNIKYNFFNFTQYTNGAGELSKYPMVVLINKGSASASEIVAGALQDYEIAKVIGETSFGKGTVQEVNFFTDSTSLKLTVAKWLTPNNKDIGKEGITPDIEIKDPDNGSGSDDIQLKRAIFEIKKLITN